MRDRTRYFERMRLAKVLHSRILNPRTKEKHPMANHTHAQTRTAAKRRTTKSAASQDALALLRADHDAVLELFEKFRAAKRSDQKQKLAEQVCTELKIHTIIEEEIFYPEVRDAHPVDNTDLRLDEALVEHDAAKKLIAQIEDSQAGDDMFDARMQVLCEQVTHHIKEEYRCIFPAARKADIDLDEIGARMRARKQDLMQERRH
jgi:hemerythrin superfamily protein